MEHNLFDKFFNTAVIQDIQNQFAAQTGVASIISDLKGVPYTRPSNFSSLCSLIRETPQGRVNCMHSDSMIGKQANHERPHVQRCLSGGLWDAGACLYVGNIHVANWLIGQVMNGAQDLNKMMDYAKLIRADEEKFSYALTQVTIMTEEEFNHTSQALFIIANTISECASYEKDLALLIMQKILQEKKAELTALVEEEPNLESIWPVWDKLEAAAKGYKLVPPAK